MSFYVLDNYYFDIDQDNQFRIAGPGNHLMLGVKILDGIQAEVRDFRMIDDELQVELSFESKKVRMSSPLVGNIRTLRHYTEGVKPRPSYEELSRKGLKELKPRKGKIEKIDGRQAISFVRKFSTKEGIKQKYGTTLLMNRGGEIRLTDMGLEIEDESRVKLTVRTVTQLEERAGGLTRAIEMKEKPDNWQRLPEAVQRLYEEAGLHISHLVKSNKTSSFEYGTIFPRDYLESAQLGADDLSEETIDYMYLQAMKHVNEEGVGWHEDLVGEYQYLQPTETEHVDRKMIDIEPLYILGIEILSKQFLLKNENAHKLKAIGKYLYEQALNKSLITFKQKKGEGEEYYEVGNWRDSIAAFPNQKHPLAPYDVNCVFYPRALEVLAKYREFFGIEDEERLMLLAESWRAKRTRFLVTFAGEVQGFALALQGASWEPLSIAHLDESYDIFYGDPSIEEVIGFAERLMDPEYFYTPVGPLLVGARTKELSEREYHGKVIWPKQAAFAVAGLGRQYRRSRADGWPEVLRKKVYRAAIETAEACFRGWEDLGAVTELYYYDRKEKRARFYLDQEEVEGQMSLIQLWSAVGCRRIVREYLSLVEAEEN